MTTMDEAIKLIAEENRKYYVNLVFPRMVANHEKKLVSRARIRDKQDYLSYRLSGVSKRTRARRKFAAKMEAAREETA